VSPLSSSQGIIRFGDFDVDPQSGELRKHGKRIKLQIQPFQVLQILLEHAGQVVTREELQKRIWPADTFVDFDQGLNNAIKKLREALADDAEKPRFVETLSKRGYRFIAPLTPDTQPARRWLSWRAAFAIVTGLVFIALLASNILRVPDRVSGTSVPQIRSLAVLPLANLSGDPAEEYFSDGMTDALITDLAQIGSLKVISRTSVMHYKKTDKTLPEIARELNVDGIVEGTVQRSGERVRITAQLIHGATDKHIWAHSYERELQDTLQLQADVARDITEGISSNLADLSRRHPVPTYVLNLQAYDDYLKGRSYVRRWTKADVVKGMGFLERSVQRDPNFAPAYVELSSAYQALAYFNHSPPRETLPKAKVAAIQALALDENLPEAHIVLATTYAYYDWDWPAEERELKRAVQLDPSSSFAHSMYAHYLVVMKRKTDAIREAATALELDPFSPVDHVMAASVFMWNREYDTAIGEARRAVEIDPSFAYGHMVLASALGAKGVFPQAFTEWLQYLRLDGDEELAQELENAARKMTGPGDPGQKLGHITLSYYQRKSRREYVAALTFAAAYIDLGNRDKTLEWLNRAYEERSMGLYTVAVDPFCDSLRSDPRFADLLRRMNLPL
jgi:TolB-like protein/DNA-binding winged helix-turn-helix (wHTH) protein